MCTFRRICNMQHFLAAIKLVRWNLDRSPVCFVYSGHQISHPSKYITANQIIICNHTKSLYGDKQYQLPKT